MISDQDITKQETETTSYLDQLVGEGKQYKTVEELAKSRLHANEFIETLKTEKQQLEEQLNSMKQQEDHLETIVGLLKPQAEPISEPIKVDPVMTIKEEAPTMPDVDLNTKLNMREFEKLALEKYGDSKTAGNKVLEYTGGDQAKTEIVMALMRTDPRALINILPEVKKDSNATGPTAMTGTPQTSLPTTGAEMRRLFLEDKATYNSKEYQSKLFKAMQMAQQSGIDFERT